MRRSIFNHVRPDIFNEISGGDLDETVDLQRVKSRALWYFKQNFWVAILMKRSIFEDNKHVRSDNLNELSGSDLDETIDFQRIKSRALYYFTIQAQFLVAILMK